MAGKALAPPRGADNPKLPTTARGAGDANKKLASESITRFASEERAQRVSSPPPPEDSNLGQNPFVKNDLAWRRKSQDFSKAVSKEPAASLRSPVPVRPSGSGEKTAGPESLDSSAKRGFSASGSSASPSLTPASPPPGSVVPLRLDGSATRISQRPSSPSVMSPKGPSVPRSAVSSTDVSGRVASLAAQFNRPSSPPPAPLSPSRTSAGLQRSDREIAAKSEAIQRHASSPAVNNEISRASKEAKGVTRTASPVAASPVRPSGSRREEARAVDYKAGKALVAAAFPAAAAAGGHSDERGTRSAGGSEIRTSASGARDRAEAARASPTSDSTASPPAVRRVHQRSSSMADQTRSSVRPDKEGDRVKVADRVEKAEEAAARAKLEERVRSPRESGDKAALSSSRGAAPRERDEGAPALSRPKSPRERDEKGRPLSRLGRSDSVDANRAATLTAPPPTSPSRAVPPPPLSPSRKEVKSPPLSRTLSAPPPLSPSRKEVKSPPLSRTLSAPSHNKIAKADEVHAHHHHGHKDREAKEAKEREREEREREKREKKREKKEKKERKERERKEKKEKKTKRKEELAPIPTLATSPPTQPSPSTLLQRANFTRSTSVDSLHHARLDVRPNNRDAHQQPSPTPSPHASSSHQSSTSDLRAEKVGVRIAELPPAQTTPNGSAKAAAAAAAVRSPRRSDSGKLTSPRASSKIVRPDQGASRPPPMSATGGSMSNLLGASLSTPTKSRDDTVMPDSPLSKSEKPLAKSVDAKSSRRSVSGAIYTISPNSKAADKKDGRGSVRQRMNGTGLKSLPSMEWSEKSENSISRGDEIQGSRMERPEEQQLITSGTLEELIAHLADENLPDWGFVRDFLVVYRYFTQAEILLNTLIDRFSKKAPPSWTLTAAEWEGPIRLRVINLLKRWIAQHFYDFEVNPSVLAKLQTFIEKEVQPWNAKWADALTDLIKTKAANSVVQTLSPDSPLPQVVVAMKKAGLVKDHTDRSSNNYARSFVGSEAAEWFLSVLKVPSRTAAIELGSKLFKTGQIESLRSDISSFVDGDEAYYRFVKNPTEAELPVAPFPIWRRSHKELLDFKTLELARQLTLIEFATFERIQPREIKSQAWMKPNAEVNSPNVRRLTERFNKLSYFVASAILTANGSSNATATIRKFIGLAKHLRQLNNFQVLLAVLAGLNLSAVGRLKEQWKSLKPKYNNLFTELTELCNPVNNYRNYRQVLRSVAPTAPALPYLGLYLKDLTFIEDGNPDFTDQARTIVNFSKMRMISSIFVTIEKFQSRPYVFQAVPAIQSFVARHPVIMSEEELYRASTTLFPPANSQLVPDATETRSRIVRRALTMGE